MYLIQFFKKSKSTLIFLLFFTIIFVPILYFLVKPKSQLPIYNPVDVNPRLVDDAVKHISRDHKIGDFQLINQKGDTIGPKEFEGKIYIADFFFTRCQTICPIMAINMAELQEFYKEDSELKFLSHSVTPVIDSVPVLRAYAAKNKVIDSVPVLRAYATKNKAIDGKWEITTGDKKHIYGLARKSYFAVLDEGDGGEQDFIHTEQFVLIDKQKQIRGFYDGTDASELERIKKDIDILKSEE